MSTTYYLPADPITEMHRVQSGSMVELRGRDYRLLGTVTPEILYFLRGELALHLYSGGEKRGCIVDEHRPSLRGNTQLIGDDGNLTTAIAVRALRGRGKKT